MAIDLSWRLACKNVLRNRRRSMSTAVALISGLIGLILLSAYIYRVQRGLEASTVYVNHKGHVAIFKKDSLKSYYTKPSRYLLLEKEQNEIADLLAPISDSIEFTGDYLSGQGLLSNGEKSVPFIALGLDPQVYLRISEHPQLKKWAKDWVGPNFGSSVKAFVASDRSVSITENLSVLIGRKLPLTDLPESQKTVQLAVQSVYGDLSAADAELGPVHSTGVAMAEDTSILLGLKRLQELYETDGYQYKALFLKNDFDTGSVLKKLNSIIDEKKLNLEVYPFYDGVWGAYYKGSMNFLFVMGGFFTLLICAGVSLAIINSSTMNVLERTKEIGTLLSIGFRRDYVVKLFVKEMVVLTAASAVVGVTSASLIAFVVNSLNIRFKPPGVQGDLQFVLVQTWELTAIMVVTFSIVSIVSCWIVTKRVSKKKIIDLLQTAGA